MKDIDQFAKHPEYEKLSQIIKELDSSANPQIVIVHRASHQIRDSGKKLGIFSGSFNPLTLAHIKMIEEAKLHFQLDEMLLLLAKANVDKNVFGWSLAGRIVTLIRYTEERKDVSVGISSHGRYIDKVKALNSVYPENTEYHFIVGYDTLIRIFDPKYYTNINSELQKLFSQCRIIAANRENVDIETIKQFLAQPIMQPYSTYVSCLLLPDFYANMSSTQVRDGIANGDDISHLVPSFISEYL